MITTQKHPTAAWRALAKGMRFHADNLKPHRFTLPGSITKASVLLDHPIYFVKLQHLLSNKGLRYAKAVTWRYFLRTSKGRKVGVAEVNMTKPTGYAFASFSASNEVKKHYALLRSMIDHDSRPDSYSLRVVRVSSLRILAVWLRSKSGRKDLVIPLGNTTDRLKDGEVYSRQEFEAALHEEAKARNAVIDQSILARTLRGNDRARGLPEHSRRKAI